ncbi:oleosin H1-like [Actinidia eriantha]|uniref:oleosin H1-like n=1 Tax=Actinidia eriantha TaxID=165200 RepID=UPI00258A9E1E|nr:oleosin H1-like [Actinidia eriantha]
MADRPPHQHRYEGGFKAKRAGPPASKILAVLSLLPVQGRINSGSAPVPVGGTLLGLAGVTITATLIGLAVATPLFLVLSPVLIPTAAALGLAVAGFIVSGAFGLTGLTSMSWVVKQFRQEVAVQMGQAIENKAKEAGT